MNWVLIIVIIIVIIMVFVIFMVIYNNNKTEIQPPEQIAQKSSVPRAFNKDLSCTSCM
jgi:heme/copper-type cytochrome/quinol oxidase subunit 2